MVTTNSTVEDLHGCVILVRHEFRIFDLNSYLSWLIRLFTKCYYNHTALTIELHGSIYVVEARSSGVYMATWSNWINHRKHKKYEILKPVSLKMGYPVKLLRLVGTPYDIKSLFQNAFYILTNNWVGSEDARKVNCAELVGVVFDMGKPHKVTPKKVMNSKLFVRLDTTVVNTSQ